MQMNCHVTVKQDCTQTHHNVSSNCMGGTGLKFESWKVQNHTKNASQHHSYCLLREYESWNPATARKVPPMKMKHMEQQSLKIPVFPSNLKNNLNSNFSVCTKTFILCFWCCTVSLMFAPIRVCHGGSAPKAFSAAQLLYICVKVDKAIKSNTV